MMKLMQAKVISNKYILATLKTWVLMNVQSSQVNQEGVQKSFLNEQPVQAETVFLISLFRTTSLGRDCLPNKPVQTAEAYQGRHLRHLNSALAQSGTTLNALEFSPDSFTFQHQESMISQISGITVIDQLPKRARSRPRENSITQATHSSFDISNTLTKNDYFSDINPKSMRRLMNIVAVTGGCERQGIDDVECELLDVNNVCQCC